MILDALAAACLVLALIPAITFIVNLWVYRPPPRVGRHQGAAPPVSVLIPARNEERSITATLRAALASRGVTIEVIVLDDSSEDATAAVVGNFAARDPRVRLVPGPPLPAGWCGKQYACAVLADHARHELLAFVDADVRLEPDGLIRLVAFLNTSGADLVSGIPRQETGTFMERLLIPLIHFLLLGFLPMRRMRRSVHAAYGAGCGQLFLTRRTAYRRAGGHAAIRSSLHDGLKLPRAYRLAGLRTDLCDATALAVCRMYWGAGELWAGLTKNAAEGLAAPAVILPATVLLFGGQVFPFILLAIAPQLSPTAFSLTLAAAAAAYLPRLAGCWCFRQSVRGALLHPLGVLILLAIQWLAAARARRGRPSCWKGRDYAIPRDSPASLGALARREGVDRMPATNDVSI